MPFLIDERYLTENTSVTLHKNEKDIKVALKGVTEYHVKAVLGTPLYERLLTPPAGGFSAVQAELLEHAKYFTALWAEHELLFNLVTIGNKGTTQDEAVANLELVRAKRQDVEAKAGAVKRTMLALLALNRADFPEYYPETPAPVAPPVPGYGAGIVFDPRPVRVLQ